MAGIRKLAFVFGAGGDDTITISAAGVINMVHVEIATAIGAVTVQDGSGANLLGSATIAGSASETIHADELHQPLVNDQITVTRSTNGGAGTVFVYLVAAS